MTMISRNFYGGGIQMYCPKCGVENPENSIQCVSCGEPIPVMKISLNKDTDETNINDKESNDHENNSNGGSNVIINQSEPKIESNLIWSILVTVFGAITCCCLNPVSLITGIVSIAFASQVDNKVRIGDIEAAMKSAKIARILNWISFGFIVLTLLILCLLVEFSLVFNSGRSF